MEDKEVAQLDAMEVGCFDRQAPYPRVLLRTGPLLYADDRLDVSRPQNCGLLQGERNASDEQRSRLRRS